MSWNEETGVPLQKAVQIREAQGKALWYCLPVRATDAYVTAAANDVRDNLDASLPVHIEFADAAYATGTPIDDWYEQQGLAQSLAPDAYNARLRFYSELSVQVFDLFYASFGVTAADQLTRVMGGGADCGAGQNWTTGVLDWNDAKLKTEAVSIEMRNPIQPAPSACPAISATSSTASRLSDPRSSPTSRL